MSTRRPGCRLRRAPTAGTPTPCWDSCRHISVRPHVITKVSAVGGEARVRCMGWWVGVQPGAGVPGEWDVVLGGWNRCRGAGSPGPCRVGSNVLDAQWLLDLPTRLGCAASPFVSLRV